MRLGSSVIAVMLAGLFGCGRQPTAATSEVNWLVMGTTASLKFADLQAKDALAPQTDAVKSIFNQVEALLSKFDEKSELNQLKLLTDEEILVKCSPLVRDCYSQAFKLRDLTSSRFNPRWQGKGTLDLGAIAKGFAVDLAASQVEPFVREQYGRALVDLGGNLKAVGGDWKVGILGTTEVLDLKAGEACATSGEYFRGSHIKDGRNGATLTDRVFSVTVVHPSSATLADGLSTVMFILGKEEGERFLAEHFPEARVIWSKKSK